MSKSTVIKIFSIAFMLTIWNPLTAGTTGKITGIVTEASTGQPLPGANIILVGTDKGAATDLDGYYSILNIHPGTYSLKASYLGSQSETVTDVRVYIDRTVHINFALKDISLELGEEVIVAADREKIKADVSYTQTAIDSKELASLPVSPDIREVITFAPGVYRNDRGQIEIRGGQMDEVGVYMDGISMQNSRSGVGVMNMPQAAIQEIQILRGGFSAQYGQAQSGVINVVTKQSTSHYNGSISVRYGVPQKKHFGPNIYSAEDFYHVGRFLSMEPVYTSMPWTGRDKVQIFQGWNQWWNEQEGKPVDKYNPTKSRPYGSTVEEARDIWNWRHRNQDYGTESDINVDGTLTGPIPFTSNKLSFFIAGHYDKSIYPFRFYRPDFTEYSITGKMNYQASKDIRLSYHLILSNQQGASYGAGSAQIADSRHWLSTARLAGKLFSSAGNSQTGMYNADGMTKLNEIDMNIHNLKINYFFNNASFLDVSLTYKKTSENAAFELPFRNYNHIEQVIGGDSLDAAPFFPANFISGGGFPFLGYKDILSAHQLSGMDATAKRFDFSSNENFTFKADYVNQINKIHMLKAGIWAMYTNMNLENGYREVEHTWEGKYTGGAKKEWLSKKFPYGEFALYAEDKIEFEGLVVNAGLRLDGMYNSEQVYPLWNAIYNSGYIEDSLAALPESVAPTGTWKFYLSPRVGVAHPLSEYSKLFFNYGYFYQRPAIEQLFSDNYRPQYASVSLNRLSAANLEFRKSIQYELGYEHMVSNLFRITVSGYYRDITNDVNNTNLINSKGNRYDRFFNTGYGEIRGFEVDLRIPKHYFVSGWANYDYRSKTTGAYGYKTYNEIESVGFREEHNANSNITRAQPNFRANITFYSPEFSSSTLVNTLFSDWEASFMYQWKAGEHFTWHENPDLDLVDPFNMQWESFDRWDLRLRKVFKFEDTQLSVFLDVRNLLNKKYFNRELSGFLNSALDYTQFTSKEYYKEIERLGLTPGNVENPEIQHMLEQSAYWIFYGEPREWWMGVEFSF